ncbi:hypothetical protein E3N88_12953 [Mikania micrantha]|uniref:RING-type E3 ubiquitin transferase n=1 Tax=Mikania micrantha TaxID=192012 RepID=A0A5N6P8Y8_9ASTR|nr:hypothetical protein E3N88_12953 [Mikania micrantha]
MLSNSRSFDNTVSLELEKLRLELRHIRGMYAIAKSETLDASRKLNNVQKLQLEESIKLKAIKAKEQEAKSLAEQEKKQHKASKRLADYAKECIRRKAFIRKDEEEKALQDSREKQKLQNAINGSSLRYQEFTWEEIVSACSSFSEDLIIGTGGNGTVYKSSFHHTVAAVKVLQSQEAHGTKQFKQELDVSSRIRHPHLLILIGACVEHGCLVYEYMENGSLDDRLFCKNGTPPIPWFDRFRIACEVASALVFLHNAKPKSIVHRDLKPANILLDQNFVSKIGDADAGEWPVNETKELAILGLSCAELRRKDRPDLKNQVLPVLERLKGVADEAQRSTYVTQSAPPNHFICPLLKDVMVDPCVADDGYTYDRRAIEQWFEESHCSPMTNLPLTSKSLTPNYSLLSAILEWKSTK